MTLQDCVDAGIPVFLFGSAALDALHDEARYAPAPVGQAADGWRLISDGCGPAWVPRKTYTKWAQTYGWRLHGFRYVVDHGGFYTLNRIEHGQVVPHSIDIKA